MCAFVQNCPGTQEFAGKAEFGIGGYFVGPGFFNEQQRPFLFYVFFNRRIVAIRFAVHHPIEGERWPGSGQKISLRKRRHRLKSGIPAGEVFQVEVQPEFFSGGINAPELRKYIAQMRIHFAAPPVAVNKFITHAKNEQQTRQRCDIHPWKMQPVIRPLPQPAGNFYDRKHPGR